jgi:exodeoxyribonuclease VII small subunit
MPTDQTSDLGALSFEDALAELERIVRGLEGGQQRLEDAITAYERGSALRQHCEAKLREAEMRVERIVTGGAGGPGVVASSEEIPF